MIEQVEEVGQIGIIDPPFVQCQDEAGAATIAARGLHQPVGIGHALGNTLGRDQLAHVILRDQPGEILRPEMGIDRQACPEAYSVSWRGSLNTIFSSAAVIVFSLIGR